MTLEIGSKHKGKVIGLAKFGAFVEVEGGTKGLVHISEVSDKFVANVEEHLQLEQEVEVKVIGEKDGKLAFSIKQTIEKPVEVRKPYDRNNRGFNKKQGRGNQNKAPKVETFEDKLMKFLKSSEENINALKRSEDTKRGGRGGRRK